MDDLETGNSAERGKWLNRDKDNHTDENTGGKRYNG
jgi:hypothetical protein